MNQLYPSLDHASKRMNSKASHKSFVTNHTSGKNTFYDEIKQRSNGTALNKNTMIILKLSVRIQRWLSITTAFVSPSNVLNKNAVAILKLSATIHRRLLITTVFVSPSSAPYLCFF